MKQRRIQELTINHYEHGASVAYTPSRTEEYAPVLAQAEAHQDLRFHAEINSVETLIILPWESVIGVYATYETADVPAPTDTICGGEVADFHYTIDDPAILEIVNHGDCVIDSIPIDTFTINGVTYNWDSTPSEMAEITYTLEIGGKTYEYNSADGAPADCADFVDGATVSVKAIGHFRGMNFPFTFDAVVSVSENG